MGRIKLDVNDVIMIKDLCIKTSLTDTQIAKAFGVSRKHINAIRHGKRWNYNYGEETRDANRRELERRIALY